VNKKEKPRWGETTGAKGWEPSWVESDNPWHPLLATQHENLEILFIRFLSHSILPLAPQSFDWVLQPWALPYGQEYNIKAVLCQA
jgi:hypothetical protein